MGSKKRTTPPPQQSQTTPYAVTIKDLEGNEVASNIPCIKDEYHKESNRHLFLTEDNEVIMLPADKFIILFSKERPL